MQLNIKQKRHVSVFYCITFGIKKLDTNKLLISVLLLLGISLFTVSCDNDNDDVVTPNTSTRHC